MAFSKARRLGDLITANAEQFITSAHITDTAITGSDIHSTFDLTGKTVTVATASAGDNDTSAASTAFVQQEIASLVDSAPGTLNTLNELAAALGDDANFSTTVTNSIATKLPLAGGTMTGALTLGDIIASGSGGLSLQTDEGTKRLFIKDNGDVKVGNLAVGSATTAPLHVAKASADVQAVFGDNNSSIDDPSIRIIGRDSGNSAIRYMFAGLDADNNFGFIGYNAGSGSFVNALNFDTSGNVGIGTTSPDSGQILDVRGNVRIGDGSAIEQDIHFESANGSWQVGSNNSGNGTSNNQFYIYDGNSSSYPFTVQRGGNIGIGITDPDQALEIGTGGKLKLSRADNARSMLLFTDNNNATIQSDFDPILIQSANRISFNTNGANERMRIANGGHVFMGTSNESAYGHLGSLVLQQSSDDRGLGVIDDNETNTFKFINNGTVSKIEQNGSIPIQIKNANGVLAEFDTYAVPKMNFHYAEASSTYSDVSTTGDESSSGNGVLMLKQQISVTAGSKILVWWHSGQILNSQGHNSNPQICVYVSTNATAPSNRSITHAINSDAQHQWYAASSQGSIRIFLSGMGATGTLSTGGTYYIYVYGGSYNSGSFTFNFQDSGSNKRGSSIIWAEVMA